MQGILGARRRGRPRTAWSDIKSGQENLLLTFEAKNMWEYEDFLPEDC